MLRQLIAAVICASFIAPVLAKGAGRARFDSNYPMSIKGIGPSNASVTSAARKDSDAAAPPDHAAGSARHQSTQARPGLSPDAGKRSFSPFEPTQP